jgi:hypothetical protein
MANDAALPAEPPVRPSEDEYQTFCAALTASARGRAFLSEYARRHRGADTETLLAALARLEALVRAQARTGGAGAETLRGELRALVAAIRAAKPELAEAALPARAAKLARLVDLLERRLAAMAEPASVGPDPADAPAALALVPAPDEPELPIPNPAAAQAPALALAHERAPAPLPEKPASAAAIPEVSWFDSAPAAPVAAEIVSALPPAGEPDFSPEQPAPAAAPAAAPVPPAPQQPQQMTRAAEALAGSDPLAALLALSEEERLALFT